MKFNWRENIGKMQPNDFIYNLMEDEEALKDYIMHPYLNVCTKDQYDKGKKAIDNLSKNDLCNILLQMIKIARDTTDDDKMEFAKAQNQFVRSNQNNKDSAIMSMKAKKSDNETKKYILEKIKKSNPSDKVYLTYKEDQALWNLAKEKNINNIPSDIIFSNQVPLKDIVISCDEREMMENGSICNFRVIVFDDAIESLCEKELLQTTLVGVMIIESPIGIKYNLYLPLYVENGFDYFAPMDYWCDFHIQKEFENRDLIVAFSEYLTTWYSIQISLLHPQIKTIYENPIKVPIKDPKKTNDRKRKIKYMKVHKIKLDDIENIIYDDCKKINRKCLCWYVIGHWREYKNGNKIFIQGYWKGALRETKKNYDEGRERVVI